jgi:hypothetical protein
MSEKGWCLHATRMFGDVMVREMTDAVFLPAAAFRGHQMEPDKLLL